MHERAYLEALRGVDAASRSCCPTSPRPASSPTSRSTPPLVAAAHEAVRTAITAAARLAGGARFTYAVCRPPGHHAGPDFLGGYCYLNNAAAAVRTLLEAGVRPVGVLDLDLHYPNGTAALVERMEGATLHSLHASPVTNVAAGTVLPQVEGERALAFGEAPRRRTPTWPRSRASIEQLAADAAALVVSLGYDTVAGDPHGCWEFSPAIFAEIGRLLAAAGLPVCVIQEGGYALPLAGRVQPRLRPRPARRREDDERAMSGLEPFRRRLDVIDDEIARLLGERFEICREVAALQERPRDPDDAADRVEEVRARYLARGAEADLPGRVQRRPLRPADRRHLQGRGRADGARAVSRGRGRGGMSAGRPRGGAAAGPAARPADAAGPAGGRLDAAAAALPRALPAPLRRHLHPAHPRTGATGSCSATPTTSKRSSPPAARSGSTSPTRCSARCSARAR